MAFRPDWGWQMKTARRRAGFLVLLALCSGLVITEVAMLPAAQISGSSPPSISTNAYFGMMARRCNNLNALAQLLEDAQYTYLPMLPPAAGFGMTAQGWLTPFNFTNLPAGFDLEHLTVEQRHGIMVVPLTIAQDPVTRDTVFLNSQGDVLYTMPPPAGYDPVAWLLAWRPNLVYSLSAAASTNAWLSLYDPARVQLSLQLIAMEDVVPYLLATAEAQQEARQQASMMMQTFGETNPPTYSPPDILTILGISVDTNGANLTVGYPDSLAGYHHFIMATSDLLTTNWVPLGNDLDIAGQNPYLWTDTTANETNESMNFCRAMTLDFPDPPGGGGGTNTWTNTPTIARFYRALAVDPLADSDSDGMPDWWEMKYFGSLTGADPNGDANSNGVNNLSEYLLGHNPREVIAPDPNAALALQVYTPLITSP